MTPEQLDRLCRAAYVALTQGYDRPPWDALPDHRRWRYEQGVLAVLQELAEIEDERPRHTRVVRISGGRARNAESMGHLG